MFKRFNTSHVKVYLTCQNITSLKKGVSIHLMLKFIDIAFEIGGIKGSFNTSHVKVYPHPILPVERLVNMFQYISC